MKVYDQDFSLIIDQQPALGKLFLGNANAAADPLFHHDFAISAILNLAIEVAVSVSNHITYYKHNLDDDPSQELLSQLNFLTDWIHQQRKKGNVLVNCLAGVSRSASVVIAYIMRYGTMSWQQAHNQVKSHRQFICPNPGFKVQLRRYQRQLRQERTGDSGKTKKNKKLLLIE